MDASVRPCAKSIKSFCYDNIPARHASVHTSRVYCEKLVEGNRTTVGYYAILLMHN